MANGQQWETVEECEDAISVLSNLRQHPGWHLIARYFVDEQLDVLRMLATADSDVVVRRLQGESQALERAIEAPILLIQSLNVRAQELAAIDQTSRT